MTSSQHDTKTIGKAPALFGWHIIFATVVAATFGPATLVNVTFSLFLPALQHEFGWTRSEISLSLTIFIMVLVAMLPVMGRIIDAVGGRRSALVSIPAYAIALMGLSFLDGSLFTLYVLFGLIAALSVGAQSLTLIKILSHWFDRRRGLAIGLCMAGNGLGYMLTPIFARVMIDGLGWRWAYVGLGCLALFITFPVIYFLVRDTPQECGQTVDGCPADPRQPIQATAGLSLAQAARTRSFWLLAITFVLCSFALNGLQSQIVPLLLDRGLSSDMATLILVAVGMGSFPGRVIAGYLMDRFFAPYVVSGFYALSVVGILTLANSSAMAPLFLSAIVLGLSLGAENDALGYMTGRYFGLRKFGQIYSICLCFYLIGAATGPYFMALSFDHTGSYRTGMLLGTVLVGVSSLLALLLPSYKDITGRASAQS